MNSQKTDQFGGFDIRRISLLDLIVFFCCLALGLAYIEGLRIYRANMLAVEIPPIVEYHYSTGDPDSLSPSLRFFIIQQWPANAGVFERFAFGVLVACTIFYLYSVKFGCPHPKELILVRAGPFVHILLHIGLPIAGLCWVSELNTSNSDAQISITCLGIIHLLCQCYNLCLGLRDKAFVWPELFVAFVFWVFNWNMVSRFYCADVYYF